jgi:phage terminase large subunit
MPKKVNKSVEINIEKEIFNDLYYPLLFDESRFIVMKGGAGSGKSYFAVQNFILRMLNEQNNRFVFTRKVAATMRNSVWKLTIQLINEYNLSQYFDTHTTNMTITCRLTNSEIICVGMDDREKVKSLADPTSIWYEEVTEYEKHDFLQMSLRLRGIRENKKQEILTFNPVSEYHWIKEHFFPASIDMSLAEKKVARYKKIIEIPDEEPEEIFTTLCHSTYKDNKFIDRQYKAQLEGYKNIDETYYKIYCLGIWGTLGKLIFDPIEVRSSYPENDYFDEIFYGLDFGYVHPSALVKVGVKENEFHVKQLFYEPGYTKQQLAEHIRDMGLVDTPDYIYCDSAEPDGIQALQDLDINATPAIKGNDSVLDGIDLMKSVKIISYSCNEDLHKEWQSYRWKTNSDEKVITDSRGRPSPVKVQDDLLCALRYAIYSHFNKPVVKMAFI